MKSQEVQVIYNESNNIVSENPSRIMIWLFLGVVTMLFAGFTSAYIIRISDMDLQSISVPSILPVNSVILLLSSAFLELSKTAYKKHNVKFGKIFILLTMIAGIVFILGQFLTYQKLRNAGIYLSTNPHSSFFYILTSLHLIHFLGGIIWLLIISTKVIKNGYKAIYSNTIANCSIYWHYFTGLWLYIIIVLFILKL